MTGNKKEGGKRTLVRWSDDLDKQLLLSIQYACNEAGLRIPWENVAKLMGEKFSDGAIVQHMSKLRQKMVENNLPVPPPLKRGVTVVPSKIYASSGSARRKSMPDTPTNASSVAVTPKPKQSASKKRHRRTRSDIDSDSQVDDMDIADSSDGEYGTSGRKRKRPPRQAKSKQAANKAIQEPTEIKESDPQQMEGEDALVKSETAEDDVTTEPVKTAWPATRTRGVRPDYSRLEQDSDEEDDANADQVKDNDNDVKGQGKEEGEDNEEALVEDRIQRTNIGSDGDVSPRSKVPTSPATPVRLRSVHTFHDSSHSGNSADAFAPYPGTRHQYQSPQHAYPGVAPTSYLPHSNMTSFSTNRNDSASSLSSSMPPGFGSQSSFGHATMGQMPFPGHADYLNQSGLDFSHLGGAAFGHDMRHSGMFRSDEDDHEEFGHLFNPSPRL